MGLLTSADLIESANFMSGVHYPVDSRGEVLQEGDIVAYFTLSIGTNIIRARLNLARLCQNKFYSVSSNQPCKFEWNAYVFKVDVDVDKFIERQTKIFNEIGSLYGHRVKAEAVSDAHESAHILSFKNKKLGINTKTFDFFGRPLKAGSFVYYLTNKYNWRAGILISDSRVFSESLTFVKAEMVLLITNLTEKEKELYKKLNAAWMVSIQSNTKKKDKHTGDMFISGKKLYMYLEPFTLDFSEFSEKRAIQISTPVFFEVTNDIDSINTTDLTNLEYLNELFGKAITKEIKSLNRNTFYSDKYELYNVNSNTKLKCFREGQPRSLHYVNSVSLGNKYFFKYIFMYQQCRKYFEFNFIFK